MWITFRYRYTLPRSALSAGQLTHLLKHINYWWEKQLSQSLWEQCVDRLEGELSAQQFNTWIRPLQSVQNGNQIRLLAPNQFVLDWINQNFLNRIQELITQMHGVDMPVRLEVGSQTLTTPITSTKASSGQTTKLRRNSSLNPNFTFRLTKNMVRGDAHCEWVVERKK